MLKHVQALAVAGNVVTNTLVPDGRIYHLIYGQVLLTTDANAANRRVLITVLDTNAVVVFRAHSGVVVPASQTDQRHTLQQGGFRETAFNANLTQISIPEHLLVPAGYTIRVNIDEGVAGDDYDLDLFISDIDKTADPYN